MEKCVLPTYNVLNDKQIEKINEKSHLIKFKKGEIIYTQGHPVSQVLFLQKGLVKIQKNIEQDKSIILRINIPGRFLNLLSISHTDLYQYSAIALENAEIIHTDYLTFTDIVNNNCKYAFNIMNEISRDSASIVEKNIMTLYKHVPGKISNLLMFFANEVYKDISYTLPLSRQEIADFTVTTKESVSRTLTEFKNDKLIQIDGNRVVLISKDLLERLCKIG